MRRLPETAHTPTTNGTRIVGTMPIIPRRRGRSSLEFAGGLARWVPAREVLQAG